MFAPASQSTEDSFATRARPFLDQHCVRCHDDGTAKSNYLDLKAPTAVSLDDDSLEWDWLLERVEFGDMPPPGEAQPTAEERAAFVDWLGGALGEGAPEGLLPLPVAGLRRLTALEYRNALKDTLGVRLAPSRRLPEDAVGHGFDHVASAQSLSEGHFVAYLEAAESVAEKLIPLVLLDGGTERRRFEPESMSGGRSRGGGRGLSTNGKVQVDAGLPSPGRYRVRAEVFGQQAGPDPCRAFLFLGQAKPGPHNTVHDVPAVASAPMIIETELEAGAAEGTFAGVAFINDYFRKGDDERESEDRNFVVRWIEVEGPLDGATATPFMRRWGLLAHGEVEVDTQDQPSIRDRVAACAALLWRRDVVEEHALDRLLSLSLEGESAGHRMRAALVGMLVSPRFLFVLDHAVAGAAPDARASVPLDRMSMVTRMSTLLWRSVPDAEWLERAAGSEPVEVLAQEMLADPRSVAFVDSFAEQWLQLRGTGKKRAKQKRFPDYSDALRASMLGETRRVLRASFLERRDLWELVDGSTTLVDRRLAEHYGLGAAAAGFKEGEWRRVSLEGTARRGLLGHASVLFETSEATRTSPVKRGKWVLDVLLGSAPPAPPPGTDNLAPKKKGEKPMLFRERFAAHRADPVCASCHARMDPIGFGLERFDAIGAQRPAGDPQAADLSGKLPDGRSFDGPVELASILREEERYLEALAERVLVFALGRGLERADRAAIQTVLGSLDPEHPTLADMVLAVMALDEFQRMPASPSNPGRRALAPRSPSDER